MNQYYDTICNCGHSKGCHAWDSVDGAQITQIISHCGWCYCQEFRSKIPKENNRKLKLEEIKRLEDKLLIPNIAKYLIEKIEARIEELELSGDEPFVFVPIN